MAASLLFILAIASCTGSGAGLSYANRWVGSITPTPGSSCGSVASSTLTRRGDQFTFTPGDGVLVITGKIATEGSLHGSLTLTGANKQPFPLTVDGAITPEGVNGTYSTPRCRAQFQLHPVHG